MKEVISEVAEKFSSAQNLKYSEILALDREIRSFDLDDTLRQPASLANPSVTESNAVKYLQQFAYVSIKSNSE